MNIFSYNRKTSQQSYNSWKQFPHPLLLQKFRSEQFTTPNTHPTKKSLWILLSNSVLRATTSITGNSKLDLTSLIIQLTSLNSHNTGHSTKVISLLRCYRVVHKYILHYGICLKLDELDECWMTHMEKLLHTNNLEILYQCLSLYETPFHMPKIMTCSKQMTGFLVSRTNFGHYVSWITNFKNKQMCIFFAQAAFLVNFTIYNS